MPTFTPDIKAAMQGAIPSVIVTCSADGMPNVSYISQVYYIDDHHVAISHQFFNKSIRNFHENPKVCVSIISPQNMQMWKLNLVYTHSETEGSIFEKMRAELEAIATMVGMEDVFQLKAAEIFEVIHLEPIG